MAHKFAFGGECTLSDNVAVNVGAVLTCVGMKSSVLTLSYNDTDTNNINVFDVSEDGSVLSYSESIAVSTPLGSTTCNFCLFTDTDKIKGAECTKTTSSPPDNTFQYVFGFDVNGEWKQCGSGSGTYQSSISVGSGFIFAGTVNASNHTQLINDTTSSYVTGTYDVGGSIGGPFTYDPSTAGGFGRAFDSATFLASGGYICDNDTLAPAEKIDCVNGDRSIACRQFIDGLASYQCVDTSFKIFTMLLDFNTLTEYTVEGGFFVPFNRTWGVMYYNDGTQGKATLNFPAPSKILRAVYPSHLLIPLPAACIPLCEDNS